MRPRASGSLILSYSHARATLSSVTAAARSRSQSATVGRLIGRPGVDRRRAVPGTQPIERGREQEKTLSRSRVAMKRHEGMPKRGGIRTAAPSAARASSSRARPSYSVSIQGSVPRSWSTSLQPPHSLAALAARNTVAGCAARSPAGPGLEDEWPATAYREPKPGPPPRGWNRATGSPRRSPPQRRCERTYGVPRRCSQARATDAANASRYRPMGGMECGPPRCKCRAVADLALEGVNARWGLTLCAGPRKWREATDRDPRYL